jgi:hypothetical protein
MPQRDDMQPDSTDQRGLAGDFERLPPETVLNPVRACLVDPGVTRGAIGQLW